MNKNGQMRSSARGFTVNSISKKNYFLCCSGHTHTKKKKKLLGQSHTKKKTQLLGEERMTTQFFFRAKMDLFLKKKPLESKPSGKLFATVVSNSLSIFLHFSYTSAGWLLIFESIIRASNACAGCLHRPYDVRT